MLRPKSLDHVALKVTDLDKTLHFYQVLGLELLRTSGPDADGGRSAVVKIGGQEINVFSGPHFVSVDRDNPVGVDERRDGTSVFVSDPDGVHVEVRDEKDKP